MILVGDIGGTNTRLALASSSADGPRLEALARQPTPDDLPALLVLYLGGRQVDAIALCGAGPVLGDGRLALSNHPCVIAPDAIRVATGVAQVQVINDFEAVAHAVPVLGSSDLRTLQPASGRPGAARLAIGPGTGLGVASLVPNRGDWIVLPGEGGHVDLAPVDDRELAAFMKLRADHGPQSAESLLSGSGFVRLHAALGGTPPCEPAAIVDAARAGDVMAIDTMQMFARWLGRVAGNAALTVGARDGVWIAGGIVPAWGDLFDDQAFITGFRAKRGFEAWLEAVPVRLITHPQPGLIGLARLATAHICTNFAGLEQDTILDGARP